MQSIDLFVYFLEFSCLHPSAILLQNSICFQHLILFSCSPIEFSNFQLETYFLYSDLQLQIFDLRIHQKELDFYENFELKNNSFKVSKFADEEFMEQAKKYLEEYTKGQNDLKKFQDKVLELSNALSYYKTRKQILSKVKNNQLNTLFG